MLIVAGNATLRQLANVVIWKLQSGVEFGVVVQNVPNGPPPHVTFPLDAPGHFPGLPLYT